MKKTHKIWIYQNNYEYANITLLFNSECRLDTNRLKSHSLKSSCNLFSGNVRCSLSHWSTPDPRTEPLPISAGWTPLLLWGKWGVSDSTLWPRAEDQQSLKSNPSWRNSNKYVFYDWIEKLRMRVSLRDEIKRFVWSLCYGTGERIMLIKGQNTISDPDLEGEFYFN